MNKKLLLPLSVSVGFILVFWHRLLLLGMVPIDVDTFCFYYPGWVVGKELLLDFRFLWIPHLNMGQPFLAVPQYQVLYPFRFLSLIFNYVDYTRLFIIFHVILSGLFAFLFIYGRIKNWRAGLFAALGLSLSGPIFMRIPLSADFATLAWLPFLLYWLDRKKPIIFGVGLALQWLAGYPPLVLVCYTTLLLFGFIEKNKKAWGKNLIIGTAIGVGLSAIQWMPFLEMLHESVRPLLYKSQISNQFSVLPVQVLDGLLIPSFLNNSMSQVSRTTFYFGPLAFALFIFGVFKGKRPEKILGAGFIVSLVLAMSQVFPISNFIPILRVFRFPGNWLLLSTVTLFVVAAFGLNRIRSKKRQAVLVGVLALDLLLFVLPPRHAWGDLDFLSKNETTLPALKTPVKGRLLHMEDILKQMPTWDIRKPETWELMKAARVPSYNTALGFHETSSFQNLTSKRNAQYRARLNYIEQTNTKLFDYAHISKVIQISGSNIRFNPTQENFRVLHNPNMKPKAFFVQDKGEVVEFSEEPGVFNLRVKGPGQLVVSESYYPGWKLLIDEKPNETLIFENNFLMSEIEDGFHKVKFVYQPNSFLVGLLISLLTLLILIALPLVPSPNGRGKIGK